MEKPLASRLIEALVALDGPIDKVNDLIFEIADPDEKRAFIHALGDVMGDTYKLMILILRQYPDLDPDR